jgi:hypothetical protein
MKHSNLPTHGFSTIQLFTQTSSSFNRNYGQQPELVYFINTLIETDYQVSEHDISRF